MNTVKSLVVRWISGLVQQVAVRGDFNYSTLLIVLCFVVLDSNLALAQIPPSNPAAARTFTLDGRLYNSTNLSSPLLDANVVINVKILDPTGACVLYEENQVTSTYSTDGYFNIKVGSDIASMKRTGNDPGHAMAQVFQNRTLITGTNTGCAGYVPLSGDGRKIRITVSPSSGAQEVLTPDIEMDSVPMAIVAESVQGLDRSRMLEMGAGSLTQTNVDNVFSNANYTKLTDLLGGTSGDYIRVSGTTGAAMPTYAGNPMTPAAGQVWLDSSTGQLKFHDGMGVQALSSGTMVGGITNINGLTGGTQVFANGTAGTAPAFNSSGTAHTLNIPMAATASVTAGLISKTEFDAFNAKLSPVLNSGEFYVGNGSNVATAVMASGDVTMSNAGVFTLATSGVTAGTYSKIQVDSKGRVVSGATLAGNDIPDLDAGKITSGTLSGARLPSNVIIDGGNSTSAPLSIGSNDLQPLGLRTNGVPRLTVGTNGFVGIGVTDPSQFLEVGGRIRSVGINSSGGYTNLTLANTAAPSVGVGSSLLFQGSGLTSMASLSSAWEDASINNSYFTITTKASAVTSEKLRITSVGNVGIGTTNPTTKLHVTGAILAGDDATCDNTKYGAIRVNSNNLQVCLASNTWSTLSVSGAAGTVTSVVAGTGLDGGAITTTGTIALATTGVTAGTYAKVTIDSYGRATAGSTLSSSDIPSLDASKITTGTLATVQIPDLDAAKITTGTINNARLPSNVILDGGNALTSGTLVIGTSSAHNLALVRNGNRNLVIDQYGHVTLDSSSSTGHELEIKGDNFSSVRIANGSTTASSKVEFGHTSGSTYGYIGFSGTGSGAPYNSANQTLVLSANSDRLEFGSNSTIRMILLNGMLGVGTTAPTTKLHVNGAILAGDDATCDNTKYGAIRVNSNNLQVCLANDTWSNLAASGATGTVTSIAAGAGLTGGAITTTGTIALATTGVTAAAYPKVTVDAYGRVVTGSTLSSSDIPDLDAAKIASGTIASARLPSNVIFDGGNAIASGTLSIGTTSGHPVSVMSNGTSVVSVGTNGRVGIGTDSPAYTLDVAGTIHTSSNLRRSGSSGGNIDGLTIANNHAGTSGVASRILLETGGLNKAFLVGGADGASSAGYFSVETRQSGAMVEGFRLNSLGNVGIGTITPATRLHVTGAILAGDDATCAAGKYGAIRVNSNNLQVCLANDTWSNLAASGATGTVTSIAAGAGLTGGAITTTGTIALATTGVTAAAYPKVTVDAYGRVVTGSTLSSSDIPDLDASKIVSGTLNNARLPSNILLDGGNSTGATLSVGTNDLQPLHLKTNNSTRLTVGTNGFVGIGTTAPAWPLDVISTSNVATASWEYNARFQKTWAVGDSNQKVNLHVTSTANTSSSGVMSSMTGVSSSLINSSGRVSSATNFSAASAVNAGTFTNMYGLKVDDPTGTGSVKNQYGVYIDSLVRGETSTYAIYTAGTTQSYFGGNVGIGTTGPLAKLHVAGAILAGDDATCAAGKYGAIRVNSNNLQVCLASNVWTTLSTSVGGGGDFLASGTIPMTGPIKLAVGSAAAPGLTFGTSSNAGFYEIAPGALGYSTGGNLRWRMVPGGLHSETSRAFNIGAGSSAASPTYSFVDDTDTGIFSAAADTLALSTAGVARLTVGTNGFVGIGTPSPNSTFEVKDVSTRMGATTGLHAQLVLNDTRNHSSGPMSGIAFRVQHASPSEATVAGIVGAKSNSTFNNMDGELRFFTRSNGSEPGEAMRINPTGAVGIGITSPNTRLHVAGAILPGDDATCDNTKYGAIRVNSNNLQVCLASNVWTTLSTSAGSGTPAGATTNVQFNSSGTFGASSTFVWDNTNSRLGIGTNAPGFGLGVGDGTAIDGGIMARGFGTVGTSGTTLAVSGAGTRMFWYPKKAAFRAGYLVDNPTYWDDAQIGDGSAAFGRDNIAVGSHSFTAGAHASANGSTSIALGRGGVANSTASVAIGSYPEAYGAQAIAIGSYNRASGDFSMALGNKAGTGSGYAGSGGNYSMAIGLGEPAGTSPYVSGTSSLGIFMGDQSGQAVTANNTMAILGGNVGIGTVSPTARLSVQGNVTISGSLVTGAEVNSDALSAITANFTNTNIVRVSTAAAACGTLNVTNVSTGGMYNLTILNATTTCTTIQLNGSTANVKLPAGYSAGAAANGVVYTFLYDGLTLWMSSVTF